MIRRLSDSLADRVRRMDAVMQSMPVLMWELGGHDETTWLNDEAARLTRIMPGMPWSAWLDRVHPDDRGRFEAALRPDPSREGRSYVRARLLDADQQWHWLAINSLAQWDSGQYRQVIVATDVSDTVATEREANRLADFHQLVTRVADDLLGSASDDPTEVMVRSLRLVRDYVGGKRALVALFDDHRDEMVLVVDDLDPNSPSHLLRMPYSVMPRYVGQLRQGEPVVMNDITDHMPGWEAELVVWSAREMRSVLSAPMRVAGRVIGLLSADGARRMPRWHEEVEAFGAVASVFAATISRQLADDRVAGAMSALAQLVPVAGELLIEVGADGTIESLLGPIESFRIARRATHAAALLAGDAPWAPLRPTLGRGPLAITTLDGPVTVDARWHITTDRYGRRDVVYVALAPSAART